MNLHFEIELSNIISQDFRSFVELQNATLDMAFLKNILVKKFKMICVFSKYPQRIKALKEEIMGGWKDLSITLQYCADKIGLKMWRKRWNYKVHAL